MGQRALRLFISLAGVATMTLVGYRLLSLNATTQGFAYLLLVLVIASAWGFFEACVASIASTLTFNFFFGLSRCSLRERLIFRLATIEGMRPGEILGLQFGDLRSQSVRVSRRVYRGDVDSPKTGRSREVALSPATRSLLSEWVTLLADQQPEAWVFQSENPSSPLMRDNVQRRFIQPKLANIGLG